jgi:hypothetical protein
MPKQAPVKCLYCGEHFLRNEIEFVQIKNRYAHKSCSEKQEEYGHRPLTKIIKPEPPPEKVQEERDRLALVEYLLKLFKTARLNPAVFMLMKKYKENYSFTYKGMLYAIKYHIEIKNNPVDKMNGSIGILPYIYNDAYEYYVNIENKKNKIENILQQAAMNNVTNTPIAVVTTNKKKSRITPIDIESL